MLRFILRRFGSALAVLLGATFITFVLSRVIPSDPALAYIGPKATAKQAIAIRESLGLNDPLPLQYFRYLSDMFHGNWGYSIASKQPVLGEILNRLPATIELIVFAMLFATFFGILFGVLAARYSGSVGDGFVRIFSIVGISIPTFWLGLLLQLLFVGRLGWLPATGNFDLEVKFDNPITKVTGFPLFDSFITGNFSASANGLRHMILPALTLSVFSLGLIARLVRANLLEILSQDYIKVARAYGLSERIIIFRLALRNALPPVTTIIGLSVAYLLTGTFFVEQVFNWPGIGSFAANSLLSVDYPAIMGITLVGAISYLGINIIVDLIQAKLDPRIRNI